VIRHEYMVTEAFSLCPLKVSITLPFDFSVMSLNQENADSMQQNSCNKYS